MARHEEQMETAHLEQKQHSVRAIARGENPAAGT